MIGKTIKQWREDAEETQASLAMLMGVSRATVSNWECDIFKPSLDTIELLQEILSVRNKDRIVKIVLVDKAKLR